MTTMQQTILQAIEDKSYGITYTLDFTYSNTGFIRALDPKTLMATRSLRFMFQDGSVSFESTDPKYKTVATHYYGKERREDHIPAVKSTPVEVVDAVIAYLKGES